MTEMASIKTDPEDQKSVFEHDIEKYKRPIVGRSIMRKLNEHVKNAYPHKKDRVLVAVIPHNAVLDQYLDKDCLWTLELQEVDTISSVISIYVKHFRCQCMIRLSRVTGNKHIGSKARLKEVAQKSHFVVLKATKIEIAELAIWEVFATQYISLGADKATSRSSDLPKLYHQMNETWNKMPVEMKNLLAYQAKQLLSNDVGDRYSQLAFWLFYNDYFRQSRAGRPHDTVRRREMLFNSVLERWQKQDISTIRPLVNDAAEFEQQFPLPQCPSSVDQNNIFKEDESSDSFTISTDQDPALYANLSLEALERLTEAGIEFLTAVAPLLPKNDLRFNSWLHIIPKLTHGTSVFPTKIGIMGATGLGKSTIINALLGEKDLLPTSFVEACTAAPIEVKFEDSLKLHYRVNVNFLSAHAWEQEINMCLMYLNDPSAEHDEATKEAAAKIKAAYPDFTKDEMDMENLIEVADIRERLGKAESFETDSADQMTNFISKFVASKEDMGCRPEWKRENRLYWPLVESIELCLKAPLLRSGAVLVDLPGVQDSNKARAAVAKKHQASCSHIFYVSDITRAASDEAVMSFIRERGKLQFQTNGFGCSTSILCSKADQLIVSLENARSVRVDQEYHKLEVELKSIDHELLELRNNLAGLTTQRNIDYAQYDAMTFEIRQLSVDIQNVRSGIAVYERDINALQPAIGPQSGGVKRARRLLPQGTGIDAKDSLMQDSSMKGKILDESEIQAKIDKLTTSLNETAERVNSLNDRSEQFEQDISALETAKSSKSKEKFLLCHSARNKYTRRCLQEKIVHELHEIKEEILNQSWRTGIIPPNAASLRDYDHMSAPDIFCVAAKSFLDTTVASELSSDDTEIPKLREHCLQLCENERMIQLRTKMNEIGALISSIEIWAQISTRTKRFTAEEYKQKMKDLGKGLERGTENIRAMATTPSEGLTHIFEETITKACKDGVKACVENVPITTITWNKLPATTWRQVIRRHGTYSAKNVKSVNLNEELVRPFVTILLRTWGKLLSNELSTILDEAVSAMQEEFSNLHGESSNRVSELVPDCSVMITLQRQPQKYRLMICNAFDELRSTIQEVGWTFNDHAQNVMRGKLKDVYKSATAYTGPGSCRRMKEMIITNVTSKSSTLFKPLETKTVEKITNHLGTALKDFKMKIDELSAEASRDYVNAVSSGAEELSADERQLRQTISQMVQSFRKDCAPGRVDDDAIAPDTIPETGLNDSTSDENQSNIKIEE